MNRTQRSKLFPIIVGGYGVLWAILGLLSLVFGLVNLGGGAWRSWPHRS